MMNHRCPACDNKESEVIISRVDVPVHQNKLFNSAVEAVMTRKGAINLHACNDCGFVYNAVFDSKLMEYNEQYDNNQNYSHVFNEHTEKLCRTILTYLGNEEKTIVEVGCGKADFLKRIFQINDKVIGYGFDPSYVGPDELFDGRLKFVKDFYDEKYENIIPDIIICRHVIEHVPTPVTLLSSIRRAIKDSKNAKIFFETPCIEWIFKNQIVWDIFYEHCSYFSSTSIKRVFQVSGYDVTNIEHVFGGQYLWIEARPAYKNEAIIDTANFSQSNNSVTILAKSYKTSERELYAKWSKALEEWGELGEIAIWGAGAKGVTFLNLFDRNQKIISCAIDLNPNKQNKYIPGTGHQIVSIQKLKTLNIKTLLIMNPNYSTEIRNMLTKEKIDLHVVDVE